MAILVASIAAGGWPAPAAGAVSAATPTRTTETDVLAHLYRAAAVTLEPALRGRVLFLVDLVERARDARARDLPVEAAGFIAQARDALRPVVDDLRREANEIRSMREDGEEVVQSRVPTLNALAAALGALEEIAPSPSPQGEAATWEDAVAAVRSHLTGGPMTRDAARRAVDSYSARVRREADTGAGIPAIAVTPTTRFGATYTVQFANAFGPRESWLTIRNTGTAELTVSNVALAAGERFSLSLLRDANRARRLGPFAIPPGGLKVFVVRHDPGGQPNLHTDLLTIASNALEDPVVAVSLVASPWLPVLELSAPAVDFGTVENGSLARRGLAIGYVPRISTRDVPLPDLDFEVVLDGVGAFTLLDGDAERGGLAFALGPNGRRTVDVVFRPQRGGLREGSLVVRAYPKGRANSVAAPIASVPLRGEGKRVPSKIEIGIERVTVGGESFAELRVALDPPVPNAELMVRQKGPWRRGGEDAFRVRTRVDGTYRRLLGGYRDGASFTRATSGGRGVVGRWELRLEWPGNERNEGSTVEFAYTELQNSWGAVEPEISGGCDPRWHDLTNAHLLPDPAYGAGGIQSVYSLELSPYVSVDAGGSLQPVHLKQIRLEVEAGGTSLARSEQPGYLSSLPGAFPDTRATWIKYRGFRTPPSLAAAPSWMPGEPERVLIPGVDEGTVATLTWSGDFSPAILTAPDAAPTYVPLCGILNLEADLRPGSPIWRELALGELAMFDTDPTVVDTIGPMIGRPSQGKGVRVRYEIVGRIGSDPFLMRTADAHGASVTVQRPFPALVVEPNGVLGGIDVGAALVNGERESATTLRLRNVGQASLPIDAVTIVEGAGLEITSTTPALPLKIEPRKFVDLKLSLKLRPQSAGTLRGTIAVGDVSVPYRGAAIPWSGLGLKPLTYFVAHQTTVSGPGYLWVRPYLGWNNYVASTSPGDRGLGTAELEFRVETGMAAPEIGRQLPHLAQRFKGAYGETARVTVIGSALVFAAEVRFRPGVNVYPDVWVDLPDVASQVAVARQVSGRARARIGQQELPAVEHVSSYGQIGRSGCPGGVWNVTGGAKELAWFGTGIAWDLEFACMSNKNARTAQTYVTLGLTTGTSLWDDFKILEAQAESAYSSDAFDGWFIAALARGSLGLELVVPLASASAGGFYFRFLGSSASITGYVYDATLPGLKGYASDTAQDTVKEVIKDEIQQQDDLLRTLMSQADVELFEIKLKEWREYSGANNLLRLRVVQGTVAGSITRPRVVGTIDLDLEPKRRFVSVKLKLSAEVGLLVGQPFG